MAHRYSNDPRQRELSTVWPPNCISRSEADHGSVELNNAHTAQADRSDNNSSVLGAHNSIDAVAGAFSYLPLPVLVLSQHRTAIVCNEAMNLLLEFSQTNDMDDTSNSEKRLHQSMTLLEGRTLTQLGISLNRAEEQSKDKLSVGGTVRVYIPSGESSFLCFRDTRNHSSVCPTVLPTED